MPLMPKRTKYRKVQRGCRKGLATSGNTLSFGSFGLQTLERGGITNIQIEACRIAINRSMKRKGKVWIRIFPDQPYTQKPLETRQGKGKGAVDHWIAVVKPGHVLFEVDGIPEAVARESLRLAAAKLPLHTKFITRHVHV